MSDEKPLTEECKPGVYCAEDEGQDIMMNYCVVHKKPLTEEIRSLRARLECKWTVTRCQANDEWWCETHDVSVAYNGEKPPEQPCWKIVQRERDESDNKLLDFDAKLYKAEARVKELEIELGKSRLAVEGYSDKGRELIEERDTLKARLEQKETDWLAVADRLREERDLARAEVERLKDSDLKVQAIVATGEAGLEWKRRAEELQAEVSVLKGQVLGEVGARLRLDGELKAAEQKVAELERYIEVNGKMEQEDFNALQYAEAKVAELEMDCQNHKMVQAQQTKTIEALRREMEEWKRIALQGLPNGPFRWPH